jgi:hypothetical protein
MNVYLQGQIPLRVFVKPGSNAERICRSYSAGGKPSTKEAETETGAAAAPFRPRPALNLRDRGGKIIPDLVYTNFFVGGSAWNDQDRKNIDEKLANAMTEQALNNVLVQYFRGDDITSTFRPSALLPGEPPDSISQAGVKNLIRQLHADGKLAGFDFDRTLFNIMLPRGSVLTLGEPGSDDKAPPEPREGSGGETNEKASSLEGLGGFHGSVDVGATRLYYAVGVFSEGSNGIIAFDQPWKNVVATFYHELVEARTDADVETGEVAWVNDERPGEEIGDIPMSLAGGNLRTVMKEVPLSNGSGSVPIQLMWSNAVSAPEGPIPVPHLSALVA